MARRTQTLEQQIAAITAKEKKLANQKAQLQAKVEDIRREAENRRVLAEAAKKAADEAKAAAFLACKKEIEALEERAENEFCIAVDEEYGFQAALWFPPVGRSEVEAYWAAKTVKGMDALKVQLGGEWIYGGSFSYNETAEQRFYDLWKRHYVPGEYVADLCSETDTYLISPDFRAVCHAGCMEYFDDEAMAMFDLNIRKWKKRASKVA